MGESLLALRAGATPKIIPTKKETPKAKATEEKVTLAGKKLLMAIVPKDPKIIPIKPPIPERMTASKRNCNKIALG